MKSVQLVILVALIAAFVPAASAQSSLINALNNFKSRVSTLAANSPNNSLIQASANLLSSIIDAIVIRLAPPTIAPIAGPNFGQYLNLIYVNYDNPVLVAQYQQDFVNVLASRTAAIAGPGVDNLGVTTAYGQSVVDVILGFRKAVNDDSFTMNLEIAAQAASLTKAVVVYVYDLGIIQQLSPVKLAEDPATIKFGVDYAAIFATIASFSVHPARIDEFYTNMETLQHFSDVVDDGFALALRTRA